MPYAWGSRTAIASLQGRSTPSDGPEAELWMGAHPVAPSTILRAHGESGAEGESGASGSLADRIARDPERELGQAVVHELGPRLPFLLKVLAAAEPLSLQAHPTMAQARAGFEDEERRGVPIDAPTRNYKDRSHKPELLCALTPFDALSGFRSIDETILLFDTLDVAELEPALAPLRASPDAQGLSETFRRFLTMPADEREPVVAAALAACANPRRLLESTGFVRERAMANRLGKLYPADIGVVCALLLELVHLEPGEAIYLGAANLHAYLGGTGIEIMASSDNVLRGGLTKKHIDVPELLKVLDFAGGPAQIVSGRAIDEHEHVYDTPAREFRLSRLSVNGSVDRKTAGPEILFATEGSVRGGGLGIPKGGAVFVPATTKSYTLEGSGTLYRATTNVLPVQ
jgi:mannose-6-phosphate isomerase